MRREIILRLTHTEARWIESALQQRRIQCEQDLEELQENSANSYISLIKLQIDNLQDLEAHVNKAAHRQACK